MNNSYGAVLTIRIVIRLSITFMPITALFLLLR